MKILFSLFLLAGPAFAQEQQDIKAINVEAIMTEITQNKYGKLDLAVRQEKKIQKALTKSSKEFDKQMRQYEKYRAKAEESLKKMRAISSGVNDMIIKEGNLDDRQIEIFRKFQEEKAKPAREETKESEQKVAAPDENAVQAAAEAPATVSEEAKTVSEKKKRVVLKKRNRRNQSQGSGNLVPAGSKGNVKPKSVRKIENDDGLPSQVLPIQ